MGIWFYVRLIFYKMFFEVKYRITWTSKDGHECELYFHKLKFAKHYVQVLTDLGYENVKLDLYKY